MAVSIVDTPVNTTRYLPRMGDVEAVIRYITRAQPNGAKHVKVPELRALKAAGKKVAIVHETWGDFAHAGHGGISAADGHADGAYARQIMPKLGAPAGACVYFAVDTDGSPSQIKNNVLPYFKAIREAFADGEYRVGIYGPGAMCAAVLDAGYVDLCWLPNAKGWRGYKSFLPKAALVQKLPTHIAGGLDVDPDEAQVEDWGQWTPFSDDAAIAPPATDASADDTPRRLGMGEDVANEHAVGDIASDSFESVKTLAKSKIAWLTGMLGGGGAAGAVNTDPQVASLLGHLVARPSFWVAIAAIAVAGAVVYFRWRDHGRGSV